jgi:hypothetical protein
MLDLTKGDLPCKLQVRPSSMSRVFVGFVGAAKAAWNRTNGEGSSLRALQSLMHQERQRCCWRIMGFLYLRDDMGNGQRRELGNRSSDHQGMGNFMFFLNMGLWTGFIPQGTEIFLFTDTLVIERAFLGVNQDAFPGPLIAQVGDGGQYFPASCLVC